jgi:hypothetical protein
MSLNVTTDEETRHLSSFIYFLLIDLFWLYFMFFYRLVVELSSKSKLRALAH